jgi:hypothetical protein
MEGFHVLSFQKPEYLFVGFCYLVKSIEDIGWHSMVQNVRKRL